MSLIRFKVVKLLLFTLNEIQHREPKEEANKRTYIEPYGSKARVKAKAWQTIAYPNQSLNHLTTNMLIPITNHYKTC